METSKKYKLTKRDYVKGFLMASLAACLFSLQDLMETGTFEWKKIGMAAVAGGCGYLLKNFFEGK
jgi:hypothetical protein